MSPHKPAAAKRDEASPRTTAEMRRLLREMPKVDIHCHLDGSLRPATVLELAKERKVKLPAATLKDLIPLIQVSQSCQSLKEFLDVFPIILPLLRDARALERAAYELCEDCAAENIRHVEARFAPVLNATAKFTVEAALEAVLKGLERGLKDHGVTSGVIVCLMRSHSPKDNRRAFDAMKKAYRESNGLAEPGVVGMDLAGDEARYPTMEYADFFEEARKFGIPATCHAGETVGTANLRAALSLEVRRIGHGTHLMEDPALQQEVVRLGVPLEIGITSNVRTKSVPDLASHPVTSFYRSGVKVTLNTDDRGIIGIDLTHEFETAMHLGFSLADLAGIALDSVDHLFLPAADRERLRRRFEAESRALFGKANA